MSVLDGWWDDFFFGLMTVLQVFSVSLVIAVVCGLLGASAKLSKSRILRGIAQGYTIVFRGAPELLVLLLFYFGMAIALTKLVQFVDPSVKFIDLPPFWAGSIAIGLIVGAYMTETFRGAILAIPKGQMEAAWAFGMSPFKTFIRITLPQMVRYALPGFTNNWLVLIKATALVSLIGLQDMTYLAKQASAAAREPFIFFLFTAALYLLYTSASLWALRRLNARYSLGTEKVQL